MEQEFILTNIRVIVLFPRSLHQFDLKMVQPELIDLLFKIPLLKNYFRILFRGFLLILNKNKNKIRQHKH